MSGLTQDVIDALKRAANTANRFTLLARIPECGEFGAIAQDLNFVCGQLLAEDKAEEPQCKCDLCYTEYASVVCDNYKPAKGRAAELAFSVPGACTSDSPDGRGACGHDRACHSSAVEG